MCRNIPPPGTTTAGTMCWRTNSTSAFSSRWGNLGGAEGIAEAIYNSFDFVVDTNYTASSLRRLLAEMKDQMKIEEDPDGDPDNPTSGTVTVSGLWKYNLDGSRINYSVEETREGDGKGDGRLDAADGIAAGALPRGRLLPDLLRQLQHAQRGHRGGEAL